MAGMCKLYWDATTQTICVSKINSLLVFVSSGDLSDYKSLK